MKRNRSTTKIHSIVKIVENIINERDDYSDVDVELKNRLNKVLIELDHIMDEVKIGRPYSINSEIAGAIKLLEKAIPKITR